jgi:hypothetical protein
MTLTKYDIQKLRDGTRRKTSKGQETAIFKHFGTEPDDEYEWSELDIYEQFRKIIA